MERRTGGRPAKFEFLFWLGVRSLNLQNNSSNLTKACGQKACVVPALEWSDWMGWNGACSRPFLFGLSVGKRPWAGEMELGADIALMEGKEPLLPWGQIRLMSWASGVSDRFRWGTNGIRERISEWSECAGWLGEKELPTCNFSNLKRRKP